MGMGWTKIRPIQLDAAEQLHCPGEHSSADAGVDSATVTGIRCTVVLWLERQQWVVDIITGQLRPLVHLQRQHLLL